MKKIIITWNLVSEELNLMIAYYVINLKPFKSLNLFKKADLYIKNYKLKNVKSFDYEIELKKLISKARNSINVSLSMKEYASLGYILSFFLLLLALVVRLFIVKYIIKVYLIAILLLIGSFLLYFTSSLLSGFYDTSRINFNVDILNYYKDLENLEFEKKSVDNIIDEKKIKIQEKAIRIVEAFYLIFKSLNCEEKLLQKKIASLIENNIINNNGALKYVEEKISKIKNGDINDEDEIKILKNRILSTKLFDAK